MNLGVSRHLLNGRAAHYSEIFPQTGNGKPHELQGQLHNDIHLYKSLSPKSAFSNSPGFSISDAGNQDDGILLPKWGTHGTNGLYSTIQLWWQDHRTHRTSQYSQIEISAIHRSFCWSFTIHGCLVPFTIPSARCPEHRRDPLSLVPARRPCQTPQNSGHISKSGIMTPKTNGVAYIFIGGLWNWLLFINHSNKQK